MDMSNFQILFGMQTAALERDNMIKSPVIISDRQQTEIANIAVALADCLRVNLLRADLAVTEGHCLAASFPNGFSMSAFGGSLAVVFAPLLSLLMAASTPLGQQLFLIRLVVLMLVLPELGCVLLSVRAIIAARSLPEARTTVRRIVRMTARGLACDRKGIQGQRLLALQAASQSLRVQPGARLRAALAAHFSASLSSLSTVPSRGFTARTGANRFLARLPAVAALLTGYFGEYRHKPIIRQV